MLEDCAAAFGAERAATVAREITKLHETTVSRFAARTGARAAAERISPRRNRAADRRRAAGGRADDAAPTATAARSTACSKSLLAELPLKQAAHLAAQITEARDNEAYKRALQLKQDAEAGCRSRRRRRP